MKALMLTALTAGLLGLNVPPAHAALDTHCEADLRANPRGGPDDKIAVLYTYAVADDGAIVSVACGLHVNGHRVNGTIHGPFLPFFSASAAEFGYTASNSDVLQLCTQWWGQAGEGESCRAI